MESLETRALELCRSISGPDFAESIKTDQGHLDSIYDEFRRCYREASNNSSSSAMGELEAGMRKLDALKRRYTSKPL